MSTLNFPAIIARLHHASDNYVASHDRISDGYRSFKLPDVVRHVGVGDRGSMSLKSNEAFWKNPIYLDQVLRKHVQNGPNSSIYSKYARKRAPRLLPKLDARPVLNDQTAAPYVQGLNVEKIESNQTEEDYGSIKVSDDDEDAAWTRNALDGNTSQEIVLAYEKRRRNNITGVEEPPLKQNVAKKVTFSNNLSLPSIQRGRDVVSTSTQKSTLKIEKENISDEQGEKQVPKLTLLSLDKNDDQQKLISRKMNMARALPPMQFFERKPKKMSVDNQSTFSRILKPESSPKTQAGKKLLSSLLLRTENENKRNKSKNLNKSKHNPGSLLLSEEYLRLPNNEDRIALNADKKYGISLEKLPAEVVGHHVQQTYEHLWKYLFHNGSKNISKSYFQTKSQMQKNNPDMIYIPTGRPEEAFTIEGLNRKTLDKKPVRLKYNHRGGEDDTELGRSKDTSPWDIDKELKSPDTDAQNKSEKHGTSSEHIVQFKSEGYMLGFSDAGIRKLSITLPPLETRTPPSTPVASYNDFQLNEQHKDCLTDCTYCGTGNEFTAPTASREITKTDFQDYPTHKKTIDFQTPKNKNSPIANKTKRAKMLKGKGPIPTKQPQTLITSEEDQTGKFKSRVYSHGQYHVKVEEKVVHRRKPKLPKDLANMFTKPYTFSYLTGVKAPCKTSNRIYTGKIANLSSGDPVSSTQHHSSLVSNVYTKSSYDVSFEHLGNKLTSDTSSLKRDAYTQYDSSIRDDVSITSQEHDIFQAEEKEFPPIVSPKLSTEYAHEMRLSPTRLRGMQTHQKSSYYQKKQSATKRTRRNKRLRSLSEGADVEEIKIYRSAVKTYDASKFFKGAKSYNDLQ